MTTFFRGALLLIVAAFLGECLEFVINIVLAKQLGEEGLGLYMSILPTIVFVVVFASLELPISISKFIAEKDAVFHRSMLFHSLRFAMTCAFICIVAAIWVLPLLPVFADYHPWTQWLLVLIIPVVAFTSVARGYFMGAQNMGKIAAANFLKRAAQLFLLAFVFMLFSYETETAIFVALCALVASELVVMLFLLCLLMIQMKGLKRTPQVGMTGKKVREALIKVSLPYTALRIFHAATFALKPFLVREALVRAGVLEAMAMVQYGKLAGVALTIGFFPAFIAHALQIILLPTVSEMYAKGKRDELGPLLRKMMFLTFLYGVPIAFIFYFFAEPLTSLFFENSPAVGYLKLLIPYFLFHYFVAPLQAFLIGIGLVKEAFLHSIWSTLLSFILMFVLGAMPSLQMEGIILGMNTGMVLLTLLHYFAICAKIGIDWRLTGMSRKRGRQL